MKTSNNLFRITRNLTIPAMLASAIGGFTPTQAEAQMSFSIEVQGPSIGIMASAPAGTLIGSGDVLAPGGGPPRIRITAASLGILPPATVSGPPEVDALSFGNDSQIDCDTDLPLFFSVDEFAIGIPGLPMPPNVASEGANGNQEASADVFRTVAQPAAPICYGVVPGNTGVADGDGMAPFAAPALNLAEPNPPTPGPGFDPGDNLDALACGEVADRVYFSLDAAWADPIEGPTIHRGTAVTNGFSPGAVLVSTAGGGAITAFATAAALGLDVDGDDLDALLLWENGNGVFDPSVTPLDWLGGLTDMLVFSVKRGSAIIGVPDAIHGVAISEGDLLTVTNGGFSTPGILIFAEDLGLWTFRTNGQSPSGFDDNLDALSAKSCFNVG